MEIVLHVIMVIKFKMILVVLKNQIVMKNAKLVVVKYVKLWPNKKNV